jgi:uncharacterized protein (TIGR03083 family)
MTSLADQMIATLRSGHDDLAAYARRLDETALAGPSGASEWDVAHVLSHLGSGAEIGLATLEGALAGTGPRGNEFNQGVWDRWNALSAIEHRDGFIAANERLVARFESLDPDTRESLRVDMGFLPAPIPVADAARMRLNEFTLHTWDITVGADPKAVLDSRAVPLLVDGLTPLIGWIGKADRLADRPATVAVDLVDLDRSLGLTIADSVTLGERPASPDAVLTIPGESWLRLATGRLAPDHTPAAVGTSGAVTLDDLRRVFPGF